MTIHEILTELENSTHPVARPLHKGASSKVLAIAFKSGMVLKEHKAALPSKLLTIKGKVVYKQGEQETTLSIYDAVDIPVDVLHSVEATEDSICLLMQG